MAAEAHSVLLACRVLAVSESGFYAQRGRPSSARALRHAYLGEPRFERQPIERGAEISWWCFLVPEKDAFHELRV
jgi:hypothetical protein